MSNLIRSSTNIAKMNKMSIKSLNFGQEENKDSPEINNNKQL